MMVATHRFATARDGTRLWWRSAGAGGPPVVLTDGIACAGFIWKHLEPALARRRRVIRWNYRGHGRSEAPRDPERVALDDCVADLLAVLDDAGERRVVLAGHSMGVQVVLEAHRRAPERVAGLLLVCGSPGRPLDTWHDTRVLRWILPSARALAEAHPAVARFVSRRILATEPVYRLGHLLEVNRQLARREDLFPFVAEASEVDPLVFLRMLTTAAIHDAQDHLPDVDVPTLVVAGERDTWTPMWLSVKMHEAVPGSEMLVLPAGSHVGPIEHPELLALRVERFLDDHFEPSAGAAEDPACRVP